MCETESIINFIEDEDKITIAGLTGSQIEIDCSSDIDFTHFVKMLAEHIESGKKIKITDTNPSSKGEKIDLIIDTIKEITNKYNEIIEKDDLETCMSSSEETQ